MTPNIKFCCKVHFARGGQGRRQLQTHVPQPPLVEAGRVPRIARMMALAIRFEGLIREKVVADYSDLARLGQVSRARITQIMNLLLLDPKIQEEILFLPRIQRGRDSLQERELRQVAAVGDWRKQRQLWNELQPHTLP